MKMIFILDLTAIWGGNVLSKFNNYDIIDKAKSSFGNTLNQDNIVYDNVKKYKSKIINSTNIRYNKVKEHNFDWVSSTFDNYNQEDDDNYNAQSDIDQFTNSSYTYASTLTRKNNANNSIADISRRQESILYFAQSTEEKFHSFEITNQSGMIYDFGLPVFNKLEKNITYLTPDDGFSEIDNTNQRVIDYLDPSSADYVIGNEKIAPYANTFLLTSIKSPDYVDRLFDGPSYDDLGSWTLFNYKRTAGSKYLFFDTKSWYKWRTPYYGYTYNRNELSNTDDDSGTMISGLKQIYYLESIETKTHIAKFYTSDRRDAFEAHHNDKVAGNLNGTSARPTGDENKKIQKLDQIKLYKKNNPSDPFSEDLTLIQTTHFEYDYSLCKGVINSLSGSGKLTLRKIYTEYENIVESEVEAYLFKYEYENHGYPNQYSNLDNYGENIQDNSDLDFEYEDNVSTKGYAYNNTDVWGSYAQDIDSEGKSRKEYYRNYVNQNPNSNFNPAPWELKSINLPSGGEIHIQYEQNDYSYIQDRPAMGMVSVSLDDNDDIILSLDEINVTSQADKQKLVTLLRKKFLEDKELIYYKFLYELVSGGNPSLYNCTSEYLDGFIKVDNVKMVGNNVVLQLDGIHWSSCRDYVMTNKVGNLDIINNCDPNATDFAVNDSHIGGDVTNIVTNFLNSITSFLQFSKLSYCNTINEDGLSFVRIPLLNPKKGGGVRVKRILTYDDKENTLYGKEYIYEDENGNSSGVALNEPAGIGDENSLVQYKDYSGNFFENLVGSKKEQIRYPLGESILSGASIGYSRVVTKNIYEGKTDNGFKISNYITAKDYPYDMEYILSNGRSARGVQSTKISQSNQIPIHLPLGIVNIDDYQQAQTQGYQFIKNNMHGKIDNTYSYSGTYSNTLTWAESSYQKYDYFKPGQLVPIFNKYGNIELGLPGTEMETVFESKTLKNIGVFAKGNLDVGVQVYFIPPFVVFSIPVVSYMGGVDYNSNILNTHVTNNIINQPAIIKSVTNMQDGIVTTSENVAFDFATGEAVISKSYDGYNDLELEKSPSGHKGNYISYNFKAHKQYPSMGLKSGTENNYYGKLDEISVYKLIEDGQNYISLTSKNSKEICFDMSMYSKGDLLEIYDKITNEFQGYYYIKEVLNNKIMLETLYEKTQNNNQYLAYYKVIKSGKTNQLTSNAGTIVTYGEEEDNTSFLGLKVPKMDYTLDLTPEMEAEIDERQELVDNLNSAIKNAISNGSSTVNYSGTITVNDASSDLECETFPSQYFSISSTSTTITEYSKTYTNYDVELLINRPSIYTFSYTPTSHPLVKDLNNWLDNLWSLRLDQELGDTYDWLACESIDECTNTIKDDPSSFLNRDYIMRTQQFFNDDFGALGKDIRRLTGMEEIENTDYYIGGRFIKGDDIINHLWYWADDGWDQTPSTGYARGNQQMIMIKKGTSSTITPEVRVATSYLVFNDVSLETGDPGEVYYEDYFGIFRQLDRYGYYCNPDPDDDQQTLYWHRGCRTCSDCSNYNTQTNAEFDNLASEFNGFETAESSKIWYRAWTDLPTEGGYGYYDEESSTYTIEGTNSVNDKMWEDQYGTEEAPLDNKFTDTYGHFYYDPTDGIMKYKRLNSSSTVTTYSNSQTATDVSIMKLYDIGPFSMTISENCIQNFSTSDDDMDYFIIDADNGYQIQFNEQLNIDENDDCINNNCISFCEDIYPLKKLENVISASSVSFTDDWDKDLTSYGLVDYPGDSEYLIGYKGKWKPAGEFSYKTDIVHSRENSSTENRVYSNAGVYEDFSLYNWQSPNSNSKKWLRMSEVIKYSPDGLELENKNILEIYSSAKIDSETNLMYASAQNAEYNSYDFKSLEGEFKYLSSPSSTVNNYSHSGDKSLKLVGTQEISEIDINKQTLDNGLISKVWVKVSTDYSATATANSMTYNEDFLECNLETSIGDLTSTYSKVAKTGEWILYETFFTPSDILTVVNDPFDNESATISLKETNSKDIYIDDFRIQPLDALVSCYVYDYLTNKIETIFDDQHFGLYYQFNAKGQLIRKQIETEVGLKTLVETEYNSPKTSKTFTVSSSTSFPEPLSIQPYKAVKAKSILNYKLNNGDEKINKSSKIDIFNVEITPEKVDMKLFKSDFDPNDVRIDSLKKAIKGFSLPNVKIDSLNLIDKSKEAIKKSKNNLNKNIQNSINEFKNDSLRIDTDKIKNNAEEKLKDESNKKRELRIKK